MRVYKSHYGWCAESEVAVGERVVRITTMKRSNGQLATIATAGKVNGISFSFVLFQDFNKVLLQEKVRCTEKSVKAQHDQIDYNKLTQEVEAFYA